MPTTEQVPHVQLYNHGTTLKKSLLTPRLSVAATALPKCSTKVKVVSWRVQVVHTSATTYIGVCAGEYSSTIHNNHKELRCGCGAYDFKLAGTFVEVKQNGNVIQTMDIAGMQDPRPCVDFYQGGTGEITLNPGF
eukprot:TRINITY_DN56294_c0_g2_i2.p2 TRINITY_DN56294_c0_g2~~TRINITY_DN56294_c0_g2_i2.p2  ORF type:complete len:135 (+),score=5.14 TRINITY_DN56294_c0_g2_i2:558-962(+)